MKTDKVTGWIILLMTVVFLVITVKAAIGDPLAFARVFGTIFIGGAVSGLLIYWVLTLTLPNQSSTDLYQEWIEKEFDEQDEE
jgi:uncharacterized membrane protein YgaE (UPF0421/DUF939 family)